MCKLHVFNNYLMIYRELATIKNFPRQVICKTNSLTTMDIDQNMFHNNSKKRFQKHTLIFLGTLELSLSTLH